MTPKAIKTTKREPKSVSLKIRTTTLKEVRRVRAWLELTTGEHHSIDETLRRLATEFNRVVTIPPEDLKKPERKKG